MTFSEKADPKKAKQDDPEQSNRFPEAAPETGAEDTEHGCGEFPEAEA